MRPAHFVFRTVIGIGSMSVRYGASSASSFSGGGRCSTRFAYAHLVLFKGEL